MRDTIDMAREAGENIDKNWLERLVELARADEREACAQIADLAEPYQAADLIRARGETK
jgi:hypothetical protein